jgi:hypothetical protein
MNGGGCWQLMVVIGIQSGDPRRGGGQTCKNCQKAGNQNDSGRRNEQQDKKKKIK